MNTNITKGVWIKYDAEPGNRCNDEASYHKLYNDLKDTGVDWSIAKNLSACQDHLCGELMPCYGIKPGDIYIYYLKYDKVKSPVLYMHIEEYTDINTKLKENSIYFQGCFKGCSLGFDGIDNKYLPELISKLREIDEVKNKRFIEEFEIRYNNYQKLLSLQNKNIYTEEELLFLYYMAYIKKDAIAISKVEKRDVQKDYENFTDENKVHLFLNIRGSKIVDKLSITSKEELLLIAQNGCLKQLNNASDDIINDKEYIMNLLENFYNSGKSNSIEFTKYLPSIYQTDIDILEQAIYKCDGLVSIEIGDLISNNQNAKTIANNKEFAYRLIDSFARSLIKNNSHYYECGNFLLVLFNNEVLADIENHILIDREPTEEREKLKERSIQELKKEKEKVLSHRLKNNI